MLAEEWDWRNRAGQLKDMATRSLLVKLDQRGWIQLPPRRWTPTNRMRARVIAPRLWDRQPSMPRWPNSGRWKSTRSAATPQGGKLAAAWPNSIIGPRRPVGENAQYLVRQGSSRVLAAVLFGSAAWKCRDRDRFIGWSAEARARNLPLITNNQRFLLLPWVRVPRLGSWILGRVLRRLSADRQVSTATASFWRRPLSSASGFAARCIGPPTGSGWAEQGRTRQDRIPPSSAGQRYLRLPAGAQLSGGAERWSGVKLCSRNSPGSRWPG